MTSLTTRTGRAPSGWLLLATGITLATVLAVGVWLLREGSASAPPEAAAVEEHPAGIPQEAITGAEKGGLAELQDDLAQAHPAPPPYVVYLVDSAEHQRAITSLGLPEGETVMIAGTPEEIAIAQAHLQLLEMNAAMAPESRAVRVVDLRQPPVTHATDWSAQTGSAEEWAAWLREWAWHDPFGATLDVAPGDAMTGTDTSSAASEYVFLVDTAEQAEMLRTMDEPGQTRRVIVVGPMDEGGLMRALGAGDAIRDGLGLPSITVVDLRTRAAGGTALVSPR